MLTWLGQRWHKRKLEGTQPQGGGLNQRDAESSQKPMVLVVDDDLFIGRLMIEALGQDYDVEVACGATEAGLVMEQRRPDLIILDIMMPGQDGQEIGSELHRYPRTRQIPFMLVSGDRRIAEKAAASGASAYLAKPFDIDELRRTVDRLMDKNQ